MKENNSNTKDDNRFLLILFNLGKNFFCLVVSLLSCFVQPIFRLLPIFVYSSCWPFSAAYPYLCSSTWQRTQRWLFTILFSTIQFNVGIITLDFFYLFCKYSKKSWNITKIRFYFIGLQPTSFPSSENPYIPLLYI